MILLDWTRMGRSYCLAGATAEASGYRVVRPLPVKYRGAPVANVGWSPFLFDGHARWEVFELVAPQPARHPPPHVEDVWVRGLRSCHRVANARQRQAVLAATKPPLPGLDAASKIARLFLHFVVDSLTRFVTFQPSSTRRWTTTSPSRVQEVRPGPLEERPHASPSLLPSVGS